MKTAFQYIFYPDTKQKLELNEWLRISRYWYNRQLGDRFEWWEYQRCYQPEKAWVGHFPKHKTP